MAEVITSGERIRGVLVNLGLLLITLVILTLGSEIFLRLFRPQIFPEKAPQGWYVKHPALSFFQAPDFEGRMKTREFEIRFKTNSMGFRDDEVRWNDRGVFRILVLGDSFVWGMGADQGEDYPAVLERAMNEHDAGRRFEVINAGVCRYYPRLEKLLFREFVDTLSPRLVLLNVLPNDVWDTAAGKDAVTVSREGYLVKKGRENSKISKFAWLRIPGPFSLRGFLKLNSHLYVFVDDRISGIRSGLPADDEGEMLKYDQALHGILDEIIQIRRECRRKNIKLAVIVIPQRECFSSGAINAFCDKFKSEIESMCSREQIPFFNAFSILGETAGKSALYWEYDGHLTPRGYDMLARGVHGFISKENLVDCGM